MMTATAAPQIERSPHATAAPPSGGALPPPLLLSDQRRAPVGSSYVVYGFSSATEVPNNHQCLLCRFKKYEYPQFQSAPPPVGIWACSRRRGCGSCGRLCWRTVCGCYCRDGGHGSADRRATGGLRMKACAADALRLCGGYAASPGKRRSISSSSSSSVSRRRGGASAAAAGEGARGGGRGSSASSPLPVSCCAATAAAPAAASTTTTTASSTPSVTPLGCADSARPAAPLWWPASGAWRPGRPPGVCADRTACPPRPLSALKPCTPHLHPSTHSYDLLATHRPLTQRGTAASLSPVLSTSALLFYKRFFAAGLSTSPPPPRTSAVMNEAKR